MHEDDFGREFYRRRKGHSTFAEGSYDRISICGYKTSFGIHNNPAAREVPVVDAIHSMEDIKRDFADT